MTRERRFTKDAPDTSPVAEASNEFFEKSRPLVNFLNAVFSESIADVANIFTAQAHGDTEVLKGYAKTVKEQIEKWEEEL